MLLTQRYAFHLCYVQIIMSHFLVSKSMMTLASGIVMKLCLPYVNSQTMPRNYFDTLVLFVMYCPCVEWLLKVIVVNFNEIYSSHWQEMPILTRVPDLILRPQGFVFQISPPCFITRDYGSPLARGTLILCRWIVEWFLKR